MAEKLEVLITATSDKAVKALEGVSKAAGDLEKQTTKTSKGITLLDGASLFAGQKITELSIAALRSVPALVKQGIEADRTMTALTAYAGGAFQAEKAVEAVTEATGGSVSKMDAARQATRFMAMGLATTADEAGNLAKIAVTLGSTMGKGPQQSFEEFALLLANQSIPRLDTFGISAGRVRERIQELQKTNEGMSRETAFMTAVMEVANEKLDVLEAEGFQAASSIDKLSARIDDAKAGVADFLADGLLPWIDGMVAINEAVTDNKNRIVDTFDTWDEYTASVDLTTRRLNGLTEAEFESIKQNKEMRDAMEAAQNVIDPWQTSVKNATGAVNDMTAANEDARLSLIGLGAAAIAKVAIDELNAAYQAGAIDAETYNQKLVDIQTSMGGVTAEEVFASQAIEKLSRQYRDGEIDLDTYVRLTKELAAAIERLKDKTVTIRVDFEGDRVFVPGEGAIPRQHGGPVWPRQAFLVGERGPELFVPSGRGNIIPNTTNNFNLSVHTSAPFEPIIDDFRFMESALR